jgi:hypothetical protein
LILFVVAFDFVERFVTPGSRRVAEPPAEPEASAEPEAAGDPFAPQIEKLPDGSVEIRVGTVRRVRIHLDDEEDADALIDCIEEGIASAPGLGDDRGERPRASFGPLDRHLRAERVWEQVSRIQEGCLGSVSGLPPLPLPPPHPRIPGRDPDHGRPRD